MKLLLGVLLCHAASAATYYVATTGNDSNAGTTLAAPWRNLSKAAATVTAGDTVIVRDGTYGKEGQVGPNYVVTMTASGTAGNPITFKAENRGGAILDSEDTSTGSTCNGASAYFNLVSTSYIVIQGFVITRGCDEGIHSNNAAHHITIKWNEIKNVAVTRTLADSIGRDGIYLNATQTDFTFDGNIFHDIGRVNADNKDHGIYPQAQNVTIINNIFYNMNRGWAIQLADQSSNVLIYNNTFFGSTQAGDGQIMLWNTNTGVKIRNNIFYNPTNFALTRFTSTTPSCNIDHNIVFGAPSMISDTTGCTLASNQVSTDPQLISTSVPYNFHLLTTSPGIDAGVNLSVTTDYDGTARPAATDIGAYEYVASAISVSFATNTQIGIQVTNVPNLTGCTIEASESASYTPLAKDVNATLFTSANACNRTGNVVSGFGLYSVKAIIGTRGVVQQGLDSSYYTRALQAATGHYIRVTHSTATLTATATTTNIPTGNTFGDTLDISASTHKEILPSLPDLAGQTVIDPFTGALIKRLGRNQDTSGGQGDPNWWSGGANKICSSVLFQSGYLCETFTTQGYYRLYWVNPADGSSNYLGVIQVPSSADYDTTYASSGEGNWDPTVANELWQLAVKASSGKMSLLKLTHTAGTTGVAPNTFDNPSVVNLTPTTGSHTLNDLFAAFTAGYSIPWDATKFPNCGIHGVNLVSGNTYVNIGCLAAAQNSYGWLFVLNVGNKLPIGSGGTASVAAAGFFPSNPSCRWCGIHSQYYAGDQARTVISVHDPDERYATTLTNVGGINATATSVTVNGEPVYSAQTLVPMAAGDLVQFQDAGNEVAELATKINANSWTLNRGCTQSAWPPGGHTCSGTGVTHAQNVSIQPICKIAYDGREHVWWSYLSDASFADATNTNVIVDSRMRGHPVIRAFPDGTGWTVVEDTDIRNGAFPTQINQPVTRSLDVSPAFGGVTPFAFGDAYGKHPNFDQVNAPSSEQTWYLDDWTFAFNGDSHPATITLVGGKTNTYKWVKGVGETFDKYKLPYFAKTALLDFRDISGIGSVLADGPNYELCNANAINECVNGSAKGDVYFSSPTLDVLDCTTSTSLKNFCLQNSIAYGQGVSQFGLLSANQTSTSAGIPVYGAGLSRNLTKMQGGRFSQSGPNAHPLPDGTWALWAADITNPYNGSGNAILDQLLLKILPRPEPDGVDRSTFVPKDVSVSATGGSTRAAIRFWYGRYGYANKQCSQRAEQCVVTASTIQAQPYSYITTDTWTGQSCATNCAIRLPLRPNSVAQYEILYLDNSNTILATGPVTIVADQYTPVTGTFDAYGGLLSSACPLGPTGQFTTQKVNSAWRFCTPAGHPLFFLGMYNMDIDARTVPTDGVASTYPASTNCKTVTLAKYGGDTDLGHATWANVELQRMKALNFNGLGTYASIFALPVATHANYPPDVNGVNSIPTKLPFLYIVRPMLYGMQNQYGNLTSAIKNMFWGSSPHYLGFLPSKGVGDADWTNFDLSLSGIFGGNDAEIAVINASFYKDRNIGIAVEDSDQTWPLGAGPDFPTTPTGHTSAHLGWMIATFSPTQVVNGNRYLEAGGGKWQVYSDTKVYAKDAWKTLMTAKYGTIGALNAAWGSNYTTFDTSGSKQTGISVGTGNGAQLQFGPLTLPGSGTISRGTLQIKVAGVAVGGDDFNDTVWGGTLADDNQVTGTINRATRSLSLTWKAGHAPANGAAITADYCLNCWEIGTGLMDEDGRLSHSWFGTDFTALADVNAILKTDLDSLLTNYADSFFSHSRSGVKAWSSAALYLGPDSLMTWATPSRRQVLTSASYLDAMITGGLTGFTQAQVDFVNTYYGDKPIVQGQFRTSNADSPWSPTDDSSVGGLTTQALRGAAYYTNMSTMLAQRYTASGTSPWAGAPWWEWQDNPAEKLNWGVVSCLDNQYDGVQARIATSTDSLGISRGGEPGNYGNALLSGSLVAPANLLWTLPSIIPSPFSSMMSGAAFSTGNASIR